MAVPEGFFPRFPSDEERINDSEVGLHFMEASRSDSDPDLDGMLGVHDCCRNYGVKFRRGLITEKINGQ